MAREDTVSDGQSSDLEVIQPNIQKKVTIKPEPSTASAMPVPSPERPSPKKVPLRCGMDGTPISVDSDEDLDNTDQKTPPKAPEPCPGTPPSPPLHPGVHDPQRRGSESSVARMPPPRQAGWRKGIWHPQLESVNGAGEPHERVSPRSDYVGTEPRGHDPTRRGVRQFNLGDTRDTRMVTARPDTPVEPLASRGVPTSARRATHARKRPRDADSVRKLKVIKRFQLNEDLDPNEVLKSLKRRGLGNTMPTCCAAVASQLLKPFRIEGIKRFTSDESDVLECIFMPAVKKYATFLSLGYSLEVWESKLCGYETWQI